MIDTLKLSRTLRAAEMPEKQADGVAAALAEALEGQVATKSDLLLLEQRLGNKIDRMTAYTVVILGGLIAAIRLL